MNTLEQMIERSKTVISEAHGRRNAMLRESRQRNVNPKILCAPCTPSVPISCSMSVKVTGEVKVMTYTCDKAASVKKSNQCKYEVVPFIEDKKKIISKSKESTDHKEISMKRILGTEDDKAQVSIFLNELRSEQVS